MPEIYIDNQVIELDDSGYMTHPGAWTKETAELIAKYDGIGELTAEHWQVLSLIRSHWEETERAPMIRTLCNETGLKLKDIYKLFRVALHGAPAGSQACQNRKDVFNKSQ